MNTKKLKILLFLFALNTITLYLYLSSHHDFFRHKLTENRPYITVNHTHTSLSVTSHSHTKPWPILPSYLPWSQNPNVKPRSCEAYFGNGFTRRVDVLQPSPDIRLKSNSGDGWFRCFYSETLQSSVCEAGRIRMVPEKILMSKGGEKLEEVIGRREEDELPRYQAGAFDIETNDPLKRDKNLVDNEFLNKYIPRGEVYMHTMRDLIGSIKLVGEDKFQCSEWIEEPTLLLTRFEYANMFHTVTDWYSAYTASRVTGLPNRPHLVFVDGHCQTQLEETWKALFSSLRYAKNFTKPVCFRHAIITPLGYETALFKGLSENIQCHGASSHELWQNPNDQKTARLSEFGEMIRASFGFRFDRPKVGPTHNVLFVRREDYLAHPRHGGKVESRLINEEEVFNAIKNWSKNWLNKNCEVNIINGLFAHMTLKEQVRAIQDASVIIGAHGAGLTHIVSAMGKSVILEIISFEYRRPHFALIAQWKGLEYHAINLEKSYAEPGVVIDSLARILTSLGC